MGSSYQVTGEGEPDYVTGSRVSLNLFSFLGTQAVLGRTFQPDDERPESERVVVLSHAYWVDRYKADPQVLGEKIVLQKQPYTVVGVLSAGFRDYFNHYLSSSREQWAQLRLYPQQTTQVWLPITVTREAATWYGRGGKRHGAYNVLARLKPGVTLDQAQAEMSAIAGQLAQRHPESNHNCGAAVFSLHEDVTGGSRRKLLLLGAAFSLVLLIACANVASLMLARGIERAKELAIRATLGAGRLRVFRQLLAECLLLAVSGGVLGLLLALSMVAGIKPLLPTDIPRSDEVALDYRALLFTAGLTLLTTLLFGLLPVWQTAKLNLTEDLKDAGCSAGESRHSRRWRHVLVVSQVALAMILLSGAGLLTKSFMIYRGDLGYDMRNLVQLGVPPPGPNSPDRYLRVRTPAEVAEEGKNYWDPLLERVRSLPGVEDAAFATSYLPAGVSFSESMRIPGYTPPAPKRFPQINGGLVDRDFFHLLKIELLQGRYFTADDRADTPRVIIVSESFARTYFPHQSPVGQTVVFNPGSQVESPATIVGVVRDIRMRLDRRIEPHYYGSMAQILHPFGRNLIVRTTGVPAGTFNALRDITRPLNPDRRASRLVTMEEIWTLYSIKPRFYLSLMGGLAALALLLATTGIYGTLFLAVSRRTHEIGIRRALGAQNRDVMWLVLRQGLLLALAGLGLGLLGARALTRFISGWPSDVSATDPVTFIIVTVLLGIIMLLACYAPARRAVRVDPLVALRHE